LTIDQRGRSEGIRNRRTRRGVHSASALPERDPRVQPEFSVCSRLLLPGQPFKCIENAVGAGIDRNGRAIAPNDDTIFIDDKQGSFANAVLFPIRSVGPGDSAFGLEVSKQREAEFPVLGKSLVTPDTVDRDSQELGVKFLEFRKDFVVQSHLVATDGAPVRRIKGQNDRLAPQLAEGEFLIGVTEG